MNPAHRLIACPYCDLLQLEVCLPVGATARCTRCNVELYRYRRDSVERTLALSVAAAILLVIANTYPIMELEIQGQRHASTLIGAVRALWNQEVRSVAALVFLTTVLFPTIEIAAMIYLLLPLRSGRVAPGVRRILRMVQATRPWGMVEVFLLGVLVSLVKLAHVAVIHPGPALWTFGALMVTLASAAMTFDARTVWARLEYSR